MVTMRIAVILFIGLCKSVSYATECSSRGRFPNRAAQDCRGYTMCTPSSTGFSPIYLTCPEPFIFNHLIDRCTNSTDYQCLPTFNCNQEGNFTHTEPSSFVSCIKGFNGNFLTARLISCPIDVQVFSFMEGVCVNKSEIIGKDIYVALNNCSIDEYYDTTDKKCIKNSTLEFLNDNCPTGHIFNTSLNKCVAEIVLENSNNIVRISNITDNFNQTINSKVYNSEGNNVKVVATMYLLLVFFYFIVI